MQEGKKACRRVGQLAYGAHEPVLYLLPNKTVNCHMQAKGASRVKYNLRVCPGGTNLSPKQNKLAEGRAGLRQSR
jgi:hypothetical protein